MTEIGSKDIANVLNNTEVGPKDIPHYSMTRASFKNDHGMSKSKSFRRFLNSEIYAHNFSKQEKAKAKTKAKATTKTKTKATAKAKTKAKTKTKAKQIKVRRYRMILHSQNGFLFVFLLNVCFVLSLSL